MDYVSSGKHFTETTTPGWAEIFSAIDRAFADAPRPEHFTNHVHCCECAESDEYFQDQTPETLALEKHPETLPLCFLTDEGMHYFLPALVRMIPRKFPEYSLDTVLFHLENRLHTFNAEQLAAVRDLLYFTYEQMKPDIEESAFDYETIWRMLNRLDELVSAPTG